MTAAGDLMTGRYRVERPLAAGGLGSIWLGVDERTGEKVALKKCALPDGLTPQQHAVVRLWVPREARAFARIRHPNVIRTLDVLLDGDAPWIVMEYVPSRSLMDLIHDDGPLPPEQVAAIGLDLLDALRAAAEGDVLHLDIKPSNVLIAEDGRVVLADFGPAGTHAGVAALAEAGIVLGSAKYVAPERLFEGVSDERSDLWSLGVTLYHAVEGRTPFKRATIDDTLRAADQGRPDPPVRAGALAPVLLGLLRRDPADRMSPGELRARLRRIAPAVRRSTVRRTVIAAAAAAVVIAFGGVAYATQRSGTDGSTPRVASSAQMAGPSIASAVPSAAPPDGYLWQTDRSGRFRVAVPRNWRTVRAAGRVSSTAPGGQPVLSVTPWTGGADLLPALIAEEKQNQFPGYLRTRVDDVADPPGAVWEYTFQDPKAGAVRAIRQIVTVGGRAYQVDWRCPATDWATGLPTLLNVLATVGPAPGA